MASPRGLFRVLIQDWPGSESGGFVAVSGLVTEDRELAVQWADGHARRGWNVEVRNAITGRIVYRARAAKHATV